MSVPPTLGALSIVWSGCNKWQSKKHLMLPLAQLKRRRSEDVPLSPWQSKLIPLHWQHNSSNFLLRSTIASFILRRDKNVSREPGGDVSLDQLILEMKNFSPFEKTKWQTEHQSVFSFSIRLNPSVFYHITPFSRCFCFSSCPIFLPPCLFAFADVGFGSLWCLPVSHEQGEELWGTVRTYSGPNLSSLVTVAPRTARVPINGVSVTYLH